MRLTEEERASVNAKLGVPDSNGFRVWPKWAPQQYNACTDACDMWDGPCACGAWHKEGK